MLGVLVSAANCGDAKDHANFTALLVADDGA